MSQRLSFDFSGANVLVTGGSGGIGAAIARAFAEAGAAVTITGRRESIEAYEAAPSNVSYLRLEMTDAAGIERVADALPSLELVDAGS